jgi:hypothetical protein
MVTRRPLPVGLAVLCLALVGCSSEDPVVERRGGPLPEPAEPAPGGSSGAAGSPPGEGEAIAFCDALVVVRAKCQRCHTEPPKNGAPIPFLTYEDFQAPYGNGTYAQVARRKVEEGTMPYVYLNDPPRITPPVQPLTAQEKETLLGWLQQGATPEGGTDCPE